MQVKRHQITPDGNIAANFVLEARPVPAAADQHAFPDALRLLATWAVRAAQAETVHLDSSAHQSDECTPHPTTGEDVP